MSKFIIAALYRFVRLDDHEDMQQQLPEDEELDICGSLLLATEGINGTVAGTRDGTDRLLAPAE